MNPRVYAILKSIAQVWLPALGTLVVAIEAIWGITLLDPDKVVSTIVAVDAFLGAGLGLAAKTGQGLDGQIVVSDSKMLINLDTDPGKLGGRSEVRFKVKAPEEPAVFEMTRAGNRAEPVTESDVDLEH